MTKRNGAAKVAPKSRSGTTWTEAQQQAAGRNQLKLRLPVDAIAQLRELADEGECSMSEVVDSLIRIEWAGKPGRKLVSKRDELAADIARGSAAKPQPGHKRGQGEGPKSQD